MLKRSSMTRKTPSEDPEVAAVRAVAGRAANDLGPSGVVRKPKNPAAVALGRLGGKKGGKARAEKLSPERRSDIASVAARARWSRTDDNT